MRLNATLLPDGLWSIEGDTGTYIVRLDGLDAEKDACNCLAAKYGNLCAHILSAQHHAQALAT
jgi:hypothetical protein